MRAIRRLADVDAEKFSTFKSATKSAGLTLSVDELAERFSAATNLNTDETRDFTHLIVALDAAKLEHSLSLSQLLTDIEEELSNLVSAEILTDAAAKQGLSRIRELLEQDTSLHLISKAINVFTEHQRVFQSCRILTDIRPVFLDSESANEDKLMLAAGTISHSLKMEFRENRRIMEFYIALDDDDLERLDLAIQRAKQKSSKLSNFLNRTDIPFVATRTEQA